MFALIQFKDSALSHFLKSHILLLPYPSCDQFYHEVGVRFSLLFVVRFVMHWHGHLNPGSASFFGGLDFERLFSVRDNYLLKIDCTCHKFKYYFGNVSFDA